MQMIILSNGHLDLDDHIGLLKSFKLYPLRLKLSQRFTGFVIRVFSVKNLKSLVKLIKYSRDGLRHNRNSLAVIMKYHSIT